MKDVVIIDEDKFELSNPITYSVSELKQKIAECDESIANFQDRKQKAIDINDTQIADLEAQKQDYQNKLDAAATAGMQSAVISVDVTPEA